MKGLRAAVSLVVAGGFVLAYFPAGGKPIGFEVHSANENTFVHGGSDPFALLWAAVAVPILIYVVRRDLPSETLGPASWPRRLAAFIVDFHVATLSIIPFVTLVPLAVEALRTGKASWFFERKYTVPSDWLFGLVIVLFSMALVAGYFAVPISRRTQTVGCYLLGLKVVSTKPPNMPIGLSRSLRRVFLGFLGLCSWPFIWLLGRGEDGSTWYDRSTEFRVVRVGYE